MRVCVFCGSSSGRDDAYRQVAFTFGQLLGKAGIGLVYGGASVGLMGVVADAVRQEGGAVIGVMPEAMLAREVAHRGLDDLRIVGSMHERKALMASLSDAFVALPGGLGTLEELFEVWTWAQLGLHVKPCALLDVGGYFGPLITFLDHAVAEGFVRAEDRARLLVASDPATLLARLLPSPKGERRGHGR